MDFGCDMVRCISLKHRTDKQKYTTDLLNKLGVNFEFFSAVENKLNPSKGCFDSHIKILNEAYNKGVQRVMIFEDDIRAENTSIEDIKKVNRFLDKNKDWEIFFLGSVPDIINNNIRPVNFYKGIFKGQYICTHSYIINRSGIERFKNIIWKEPHTYIDMDVYLKHDKTYSIFPCFYKQRAIKNDIGGNSDNIMLLNNILVNFRIWYALNINIKISTLLVLIIILSLIIPITRLNKKRNYNKLH